MRVWLISVFKLVSGEHFLESIFPGAFGGEHFSGEHLDLHQ